MSWKDLSIPQKAELIRMGVKAGIGLKQLQSLYDEQQSIEGVIKEEQTIDNNKNVQQQDPSVYIEELIKEAEDAYIKYSQDINDTIYNPSRDNPPFIQRILNNDKRSVKDWQNEGYYSTHKLSYAQTPEGFVVYPDVQDINGQLHDFTDPKYNHGRWDALDSAIQRGDTLVFPTEQKAREYTETYKTLYPEYFNSFTYGGYLFPNQAFSHKFEEGGYTNPSTTSTIEDEPKVIKKGTVSWNPFNVFNRNYRGAPIYESENFGDSFRQARIDKAPIFIWNGEAYNTNLKPNPLVEAARAWDTQGDLRKIEFQKKIIRDPEGTMEYFREKFPKDTYVTLNKNWDNDTYIINDMYKNGALGMPDNVIIRGTRYDIGDQLWDYLNTTDLTYNQKLALMANSYKESMGWTTTRQIDGPAKGYYQLEKEEFKKYKKWLEQEKLKDNIISETKYIIDLFKNHRDRLITPISANLDIEDIINNYKDVEEAEANKHRSAYMHRGYYTEDALRDWDEGDLDAAVKAMEALFEKAGVPRIEDRQKIAWLLSEIYK